MKNYKYCKLFHKRYQHWIGFIKNDPVLLSGKIPPHALLSCSKCGWAVKQRPAYEDAEGKWRVDVNLNEK